MLLFAPDAAPSVCCRPEYATAAEELLSRMGVDTELRTYEVGHSGSPDMVADIVDFIHRVLPEGTPARAGEL